MNEGVLVFGLEPELELELVIAVIVLGPVGVLGVCVRRSYDGRP